VHFTTAVINGADSSVNDLHLEVSLFLIYIFVIDIFFFFAAGFFDCPWLRKPVKLLRSWLIRCACDLFDEMPHPAVMDPARAAVQTGVMLKPYSWLLMEDDVHSKSEMRRR